MGRNRKKEGYQDGAKVLGTYPLETVLDDIGEYNREFQGYLVRMSSLRYHTFAKGLKCAYCDLVGSFFALQESYNGDREGKQPRAHFNLYALDPRDGTWVLMTKDHILPRAEGGKDTLDNLVTACRRCNAKKADKLDFKPPRKPKRSRKKRRKDIMAHFAATVERITIEPHPDADRLELAAVGDYRAVVGKGQFKTGDLVAYIPEQAVVPDPLLEEMGLKGRLAGKAQNRVKAIKLRGVLSQGLCYPAREGWEEGQDVTEELGIVKYVPPIPSQMDGEVYGAGFDYTVKYDIENYKRFPDVLVEGEPVVFTEKIHGTWTQVGVVPDALAHEEHGTLMVTSKGFAEQGIVLIPNEENEDNLYFRAVRANNIEAAVRDAFDYMLKAGDPVFVLGETFGSGVQDLGYGYDPRKDNIGFRVFDIYVGVPGHGRYLNDDELDDACKDMNLDRVPVLYRGPFSKEVMAQHTDGTETVSGEGQHIREGIVMRPQTERRHPSLGRVQLKSVSEHYLLRKGGTEYN